MLNDKSILVTGGTGSFGKRFIQVVLEKFPRIKRIVVYSRDELKQFEISHHTSYGRHQAMRYFIGDIRDEARLKRATEGIDYIVHAAALKHVPVAEYNPMECIKTNIIGAENVINAALDGQVKKVIALSTDKAAGPINLYGATKLCSDKLFVAANNLKGSRELTFSVVRYGNVMGSRGSVIPFFLKKRSDGALPITHESMTRFNITLDEGVELVLRALESSIGGEIFVPQIPSYKICDVAEAIAPSCKKEIIGVRPGEKIHEEMITEGDAISTIKAKDFYVIVPFLSSRDFSDTMKRFKDHFKANSVSENFRYNSGLNDKWLSVENIRQLITEHIDPNFEPL